MLVDFGEGSVGLVVGFLVGMIATKVIDLYTDRIYYQGRTRRNKRIASEVGQTGGNEDEH